MLFSWFCSVKLGEIEEGVGGKMGDTGQSRTWSSVLCGDTDWVEFDKGMTSPELEGMTLLFVLARSWRRFVWFRGAWWLALGTFSLSSLLTASAERAAGSLK